MKRKFKIFCLVLMLSIPLISFAQEKFEWTGSTATFTHGTANLAAYLDFGDVTLWGYMEITLTSHYSNQLSTGQYGKRYSIGRNAGEELYSNASEVFAALGPVAAQWKLGDFVINSSNHLIVPVYHLVTTGNPIIVHVNGVSVGSVNTGLITLTTPAVLTNTQVRDYVYHLDKIAIGTAKHDADAMLTVAGKINARELKVAITTGADFVFDPSYNLLGIKELERYIKQNKRLPGIASANEMQTNGLNVGAFQIKLLQKIEELTLLVIEQGKEIEVLKKQNKPK